MGQQGEKWYFSITDVCGVLMEQPNTEYTRNYWKVLKHRFVKESKQTVTNCDRLKFCAFDGKLRMTDVADTEQLFHLLLSNPSTEAGGERWWLCGESSTHS